MLQNFQTYATNRAVTHELLPWNWKPLPADAVNKIAA